jgi:putative transposase
MIPLNSLQWMRQNNVWKLYAFSLMPNHLHILVKILDGRPVEKVMGQFHSFTEHAILDYLKGHGPTSLLQSFKAAGIRKGDREFLIWEDSLAKCVETEYVLLETIEYIHNNACNKKWRLVSHRSQYRYSSACYYDIGTPPIIGIDDYRELVGETPSY